MKVLGIREICVVTVVITAVAFFPSSFLAPISFLNKIFLR